MATRRYKLTFIVILIVTEHATRPCSDGALSLPIKALSRGDEITKSALNPRNNFSIASLNQMAEVRRTSQYMKWEGSVLIEIILMRT